jgi:hypothetical protein
MNITASATIEIVSSLTVSSNGILRILGPATIDGTGSFLNQAPLIVNTNGTANVSVAFTQAGADLTVERGELYFSNQQQTVSVTNVEISSVNATLTMDGVKYLL